MNNFIYDTPTKVYFGKDEELKIGKIISEYHPTKVLIHFGGASARKSGLLDRVENCLREENINFVELGGVVANPELSLVREGIALGQKEGVDFILAVGGGSVLDSSKAIANGIANPEIDVWDFSLGKAAPVSYTHLRDSAERRHPDTGCCRIGDEFLLRNYQRGDRRKKGLQQQLQPYEFRH